MGKPSIGVDLGGTIENSWAAKRAWFALRGFDLGAWPRSRADIIEEIGGDDALYEHMATEVYDDTHILAHNVFEGVHDALDCLADRFRVVVVSTRTEEYRPTTLEWLHRHGIDKFVAEVALLGANHRKLGWCLKAGALALIDDDLRHLEPCGRHNRITRIHFSPGPKRPQQSNGNIASANNWAEVVRILDSVRT